MLKECTLVQTVHSRLSFKICISPTKTSLYFCAVLQDELHSKGGKHSEIIYYGLNVQVSTTWTLNSSVDTFESHSKSNFA